MLKIEQIHVLKANYEANSKEQINSGLQPFVIYMQHVDIFLCGCPTLLCRRLKLSLRIKLNMGWHIEVFCASLSWDYFLDVIEHSYSNHSNISDRLHIPEPGYLSQSNFGHVMAESQVFLWICGKIVMMDDWRKIWVYRPFWQSQLVVFTKSLFIISNAVVLCRFLG